MALRIFWTEEALFGFEEILEYISNRFGKITVKKYASQVELVLLRLTTFPDLGKIQVEETQIRGVIVNKKTTIIYYVDGDYLRLLNFFDNRIPQD